MRLRPPGRALIDRRRRRAGKWSRPPGRRPPPRPADDLRLFRGGARLSPESARRAERAPSGGSGSGSPGRASGGGSSPFTMAAIVVASAADGTIASTVTFAIALAGIPEYSASSGSWTIVPPPAALITARPAEPSSRVPDSTTPTTRLSKALAAERNRTSIEGRWPFSRGPTVRRTRLSSIARWWSGGATRITPSRSRSPSRAGRHGSFPARPRMCASMLGLPGEMCSTMQIAAREIRAADPSTSRMSTSTPPGRRADHNEIAASVGVSRGCGPLPH